MSTKQILTMDCGFIFREILRAYFPTVTRKQIEEMSPLVIQLSSWREQKLNIKSHSLKQETDLSNQKQFPQEFGKNILLSYDPTFFLDEISSDENEDIIEDQKDVSFQSMLSYQQTSFYFKCHKYFFTFPFLFHHNEKSYIHFFILLHFYSFRYF